jgi:hypothetical protein
MRPFALPCFLLLVWPASQLAAQTAPAQVPDLRERIELFSADLADLQRRYDVPMSGELHTRLRERLQQEQHDLQAIDFATLPRDARIDFLLLENHVRRELQHLEEDAARDAEIACPNWCRLRPDRGTRRSPPPPRERRSRGRREHLRFTHDGDRRRTHRPAAGQV